MFIIFLCNLFSNDSRSNQKYSFKVKAKSVLNLTDKKNIDTKKGTNTTLCIKEKIVGL